MTEDKTGGLHPQYQTYARQKCFVAYSEQAQWSIDLLSACEDVLSQPEYNLEIDYARKHFAADVPLRQKALELIANAHYGIYDISFWRQDERSPWQMPRNVAIELGIAIALNRPILLLRHASNRDLPLPTVLQGIEDRILEFSGTTTLKKVLGEHLHHWINISPETAWWNRHCNFGGKVCTYREAHPRATQFGKKELNCTIADGRDPCRPDFRSVVEDVFERFGDITHVYLDSLPLTEENYFLLCNHCQITRSSPFAIYRITAQTPLEAFISIGISLALETQFEYKIPKILIAENIQVIPSLLSGYEVFISQNDLELKSCLKTFMPKVIKVIRETTWKPRPLPFVEILAHELSNEIELDRTQEKFESDNLSRKKSHQPSTDDETPPKKITRVYELSKELNIENRDVLMICEDLNIAVKSHSSSISDKEAEQIRAAAKAYKLENRNTQKKYSSPPIEKIRVYELSKELNIENRDVLMICEDLNIAVKSHSSSISNKEAEQIRAAAKAYAKSNPSDRINSQKSSAIYVGNLSYEITEEDLKQVFAEYGTVKRIQLPTDRETGRMRGFAFVEMLQESEEDAAIEALDGAEWMGRDIKLNKTRPRNS